MFLEYENDLGGKRTSAIVTTSKVHPELERHVEPVVFPGLASLTSADVVDRVARGGNQFENLVDPGFASVTSFDRDAWSQSESHQAEENSLEERFVFFVKRTIQEYVSIEFGVDQPAVLSFGRKRVLAIGVSLADTTVTVMNVQLSSPVSGDLACGLNGFALGREFSRDAIGADPAYSPFPVSWNDVQTLAGHLVPSR